MLGPGRCLLWALTVWSSQDNRNADECSEAWQCVQDTVGSLSSHEEPHLSGGFSVQD